MTKEEIRQRMGERIATLRKQRGMTQQQMADAIGIQRPHVARIETGRYNFNYDVLEQIAQALGGHIDIVTE
jgi:transcriptional regulator with XRE-family HTH domain